MQIGQPARLHLLLHPAPTVALAEDNITDLRNILEQGDNIDHHPHSLARPDISGERNSETITQLGHFGQIKVCRWGLSKRRIQRLGVVGDGLAP